MKRAPVHPTDPLELAFGQGKYTLVTQQLGALATRSARQEAMLGMARLRLGQFSASEIPLLTAMGRGDLEASVEYGNLLRAVGEHRRAAAHLEALLPSLSGELRFRALRWLGVAKYGLSDPAAMQDIEAARAGYLSLGDTVTTARISHTLAALYFALGEIQKAKKLLDQALPQLQQDQNPRPLLSAYNTLIDLQLEAGFSDEAAETLHLADELAQQLGDEATQLKLEARRVYLMLKTGDYSGFVGHLEALRAKAEDLEDLNIYAFASNQLANHLSRTGQHASALRVMAQLNAKVRERSLETLTVSAMLTLRRGDPANALGELTQVRQRSERMGAYLDATRASLLCAYCAYRMNDHALAMQHLTLALQEMAGWPLGQARGTLGRELKDVEELLAYARMTPELLPVLSAALEESTLLLGAQRDDLFSETALLELNVLGTQPQVLLGGVPSALKLPYTYAILAYLALEPRRNRHEITADLWGDHDGTKAGNSFRQALMEIRRVLGPDIIVMEGAHQLPQYSISPKVAVQLDSQRVLQLVARGEIPAAVSAYTGPFLGRLPETDWLEMQRDALKQSLTNALHAELRQAQLRGEERRVVVLASAILEIDPDDFEVEDLRLETAQRVSSPVEYARFESQKKRRLN